MVLAEYSNRSKFALPPFGGVLILLLLVNSSYAAESPLFAENSVLHIRLTGPLRTLFKNDSDRDELKFSLRANDIEHSIKVQLRGKSRRVVCDFPPLRLNFSSADTAESVFAGQDKLKLVTHCHPRSANEHDVLQEYAAYRILNILTDHSFRVRLLRITYDDIENQSDDSATARYGFLIEPRAGLAVRVGSTPVELSGVRLSSLDGVHAASVFIFQYLIGNTDWSLVSADGDDACCHNGDLFEVGSVRYFVPYDFDRSGLVNARYARPDPSLRISRVTQRLYRGYCIAPENIAVALNAIISRREEILNVVAELPDLPQKKINATTKYLERFFKKAENKEKLVEIFARRCL